MKIKTTFIDVFAYLGVLIIGIACATRLLPGADEGADFVVTSII